MHIVETQVASATLEGGQEGLRVIFWGEGGERVTVEMATSGEVTDPVARAKEILIQTAALATPSDKYDRQGNDDSDEGSLDTVTEGPDSVYQFEYRDGGVIQRLPDATLPSAEVARDEALRCALELLVDLKPGEDDLVGWLVRVSDQNGRLLFTIDVSDAEVARNASELD